MNGSVNLNTQWAIYEPTILIKHVGTSKAFKFYLGTEYDRHARLLVEKTEAVSDQGML